MLSVSPDPSILRALCEGKGSMLTVLPQATLAAAKPTKVPSGSTPSSRQAT
jgi:hypothetical protein